MAAYKRVTYEPDHGQIVSALSGWPCQIIPMFRHDGGTFGIISRSCSGRQLHASQAAFDRAMIAVKPKRLVTQCPLLMADYIQHRLHPTVQCPELVYGYLLIKQLKNGLHDDACIVRMPGAPWR